MKYFFSLILVLIVLAGNAQQDSLAQAKLKRSRDWKPSMLLVNIDATRAIGSIVTDRKSFEAGLMVDSDIYFLDLEVGRESIEREETYNYLSEGNYFRIGVSKNMSPFSKDRNIFTFGLRYAQSNFKNNISFTDENIFFGPQNISLSSNDMIARWVEFTGGIKIRVWQELYVGYMIRLKMFKNVINKDGIEPWDIPGFGRHKRSGTQVKSTNVGLNYHISWRIPYRDKPIPRKPK